MDDRYDNKPYQQSVCFPLDVFVDLFGDLEKFKNLLAGSVEKIINTWNEKNLAEGMQHRRATVQKKVPLHYNDFTQKGRREEVYILMTVSSFGFTKEHMDDERPPPIEKKDLTVTIKHLDSLTESTKEDRSATYFGLVIPSAGYAAQLEHFQNLLESDTFEGFVADTAVIHQSLVASAEQQAEAGKRTLGTGKEGGGRQQKKQKKLELVEDDDEEAEEEDEAPVQASQHQE